jgi:hypothetical protein
VDAIPPGLNVVVGHDARSETAPMVSKSPLGGRAVLLDTGCGKGGTLSWMDLGPDEQERMATSANMEA